MQKLTYDDNPATKRITILYFGNDPTSHRDEWGIRQAKLPLWLTRLILATQKELPEKLQREFYGKVLTGVAVGVEESDFATMEEKFNRYDTLETPMQYFKRLGENPHMDDETQRILNYTASLFVQAHHTYSMTELAGLYGWVDQQEAMTYRFMKRDTPIRRSRLDALASVRLAHVPADLPRIKIRGSQVAFANWILKELKEVRNPYK